MEHFNNHIPKIKSGSSIHASQIPSNCVKQKFVSCTSCVVEDLVVGDEAPVGSVAQVLGHGVKVGVGVHGEEGREKDGEVREEVKGEVEQLREKRSSWMVSG